ncbi:MAG: hypothetical protein EPN93_03415 [Spirochaetes bacterium]|nr:MAG: hypothetical protein EPN93_03415 [Spirochaetota bacterium]
MKKLRFSFKRFRLEIYDKPGEWMKEEDLKVLQERVSAIAEKRIGRRPNFSFFNNTKYLQNKLIVICHDKTSSKDVTCCVMSYLGKYLKSNVIHLGAVYSNSEDKGLMKLIYVLGLIFAFMKNNPFRRLYVTSLTHTPKIFGVVNESFDNIYPNSSVDTKPSRLHHKLKEVFMRTYLKEWDFHEEPHIPDTFIIKGFRVQADGSLLYPDTVHTVPKHRKQVYNERCFSMIDYGRGDEILQTGLSKGLFSFVMKNASVFG